jgi:hypothetical protein
MESINQSYSIYAGYVLAPLRFMGFAMSTIGLACSLSFLDRVSWKRKESIQQYLCKRYVSTIQTILGIDIQVIGKENINSDPKIIVGNHIHIYDAIVLSCIYDQFPAFITVDDYNFWPMSPLISYSNTLLCCRTSKNGTVEKIKQYVSEGNQLFMFPDACEIIPDGDVIAPFFKGAFVTKCPIQPVVIRYQTCHTENINWNDNTLSSLMWSALCDGHFRATVKILPTETFDERYKTHDEYKDYIHNQMSKELQSLPKQGPQITLYEKSTEYTMKYLMKMPFAIGISNYISGMYRLSSLCLFAFIFGYFAHYYPTRNSITLDRIYVPYSVLNLALDNIVNYHDFVMRCVFSTYMLYTFYIFYRRENQYRRDSSYTEKDHIWKTWFPGYCMVVYVMITHYVSYFM